MYKELEVGKTYLYNNDDNACELPATILMIGKQKVFYIYENAARFEYAMDIEKFKQQYGNKE